jgi:hypothetical protein
MDLNNDSKNRPYNSNAGPVRNQEMVEGGAAICLAFHRAISLSKGTKGCCRRAIEAGIPTYLIDSQRAEPRRLRQGDARLREADWSLSLLMEPTPLIRGVAEFLPLLFALAVAQTGEIDLGMLGEDFRR